MTEAEEKRLAKIAELYRKRQYHQWRVNEKDAQIKVEMAVLARLRGVGFLRLEVVRAEIDRLESEKKKEEAGG